MQHTTVIPGKGAATVLLLPEAAPLPAPGTHFSSSWSSLPSSASRGAGTASPHHSATAGAALLCPHQPARRHTCLHTRPQNSEVLPELAAVDARHPDSGVTGTLCHQPWAASLQGHTAASLRGPVRPSPTLGQAHGDFADCRRSDRQQNPPAPSIPARARSSRPRAGFPPVAARTRHGSSLWGCQDGPSRGRPREGAQPRCSGTHASKGDTWTLYKNHKCFCTRTWGRGGESLPSPAPG